MDNSICDRVSGIVRRCQTALPEVYPETGKQQKVIEREIRKRHSHLVYAACIFKVCIFVLVSGLRDIRSSVRGCPAIALRTDLVQLAVFVTGDDVLDLFVRIQKITDGYIMIQGIDQISNILTHVAVDVPFPA